jgi:hypothetical protein
METETKEFFTSMLGATIDCPSLGEFVIVGYNCNSIYIKKQGGEGVYKMRINTIKSLVLPGDNDIENDFIEILQSETGLTYSDVKIQSVTRKNEYKEFRFFHMMFRNKVMNLSLERAGLIYNKDHATCLNANMRLCEYYQTSKDFRQKYERSIKYILELRKNAFSRKK